MNLIDPLAPDNSGAYVTTTTPISDYKGRQQMTTLSENFNDLKEEPKVRPLQPKQKNEKKTIITPTSQASNSDKSNTGNYCYWHNKHF